MPRMPRSALNLLLLAALTACAGEIQPPPPAPIAASPLRAPSSSLSLSQPPPAPKTWLDAPDTDPEVRELGRAALTCPWLGDGVTPDCAPHKAWEAAEAPFKDGKADPTLINMLEDPGRDVRVIAVRKLERWGKLFRADPALAARVVAAAERERFANSDLAARLGTVTGMIDVEGTGLFDRVAAIIRNHPLRLVRSYLIKSLPRHNPTSAQVRRIVEAAIDDPEWEVRLSAAEAYQFVEAGTAESCAFWFANLTHKDAQVVGQCAYGLSEDRCAPLHERMLATLEKSDALTAPFSMMGYALQNFCKGSAAPSRQRSRATALAHKMAETGRGIVGCLRDNIRQDALDAVVACDPKAAKAYIGRFLKDQDEELRKHAGELLKGL